MAEESTTKGERTRAEIVQAAHRLFIEQGYHGTSMRQIADRAGLALGGIYNHFAGKEDIFASVLLEYHPFQEILPALMAAQGETIEQFVRSAATRMLDALGKRPDFLNLIFIELVEFQGQHLSWLLESLQPKLLESARRFAQIPGVLRPIPAPIMIRAFVGLFFSYFITELLIGDRFLPELQANALEYFVDIYLHGILGRDEAPGEGRE